MSVTLKGVVKDGIIVPERPLPEGTPVQITVLGEAPGVTQELQEELDAWALGSAQALEAVERLADEGPSHAQG